MGCSCKAVRSVERQDTVHAALRFSGNNEPKLYPHAMLHAAPDHRESQTVGPEIRHVEHEVCKAPLVIEPDLKVGKKRALAPSLAGIDHSRMQLMGEIDRCVGVVEYRYESRVSPRRFNY